MDSSANFTFDFLPGISAIDAATWNALCASDYPFLRHEFLSALEDSGSVSRDTGWQPHHVCAFQNGEPVAVLPLYIKRHSYGEYVFDWAWAEAYQRYSVPYYPKLLSAIPFTPSSGPRLGCRAAVDKGALINALVETLQARCAQGFSSWHLLFPESEEFALWRNSAQALQPRTGCQFHWFNRGYESFDAFLTTFTSRKRKNLRRERRRVQEQGLTLKRLTGDQIGVADLLTFYRFYQATYLKRGQEGYLNEHFFLYLLERMPEQLLLVTAEKGGDTVAGALCLFDNETLYGRYWGCIEEYECLHFEACFYQGIEFCIERQLKRFDPGAQGEHKIQRGFEPVKTWSLHWIEHPAFREAIERFLQQERAGIEQYARQAAQLLPFRQEN